jgi:phospholipid transport system substrate-binding protein
MTRHPTRRALLLLAAAAMTAPGTATAQADAPAAPIRLLNDALLKIMHAGAKTPFADRAKLITPAIQAAFDLPQILKTSVGPHWSAFPGPQQNELMDVFRRYTIASYVANFDGFSGETFEILPQTRAVGADQVVMTRIVPMKDDPTRIDYVMRHGPEGWKAVDVLLDGSISRVAVQRSDFRALVHGGDAAALIASLKAKTAALEAGGKS